MWYVWGEHVNWLDLFQPVSIFAKHFDITCQREGLKLKPGGTLSDEPNNSFGTFVCLLLICYIEINFKSNVDQENPRRTRNLLGKMDSTLCESLLLLCLSCR